MRAVGGQAAWRNRALMLVSGDLPAVSNAAMLSARRAEPGLLLVSSSSDIHGSITSDTIVQKKCSLHVRGNLLGSLTIEPGAKVVVEGSVDGKIINRGGRLVVNNKGLAAYVTLDGPPEAEACGVLKVNLTAMAANFENLAKRTEAECAAVVKGNAYGCGIDPIAGALAKTGCKTFFVSNLPEAKRVRAVAPNAAIYVLNGLYSGTGARPSPKSMRGPSSTARSKWREWDVFRRLETMAGRLRAQRRHRREPARPFDGRSGRVCDPGSIRWTTASRSLMSRLDYAGTTRSSR